MPKSTLPKVELQPRHHRLLTSYLAKASIPLHYQKRLTILVKLHEGLGTSAIIKQLSTTSHTVSKWRRRWLESYDDLCAYESTEKPSDSAFLTWILFMVSDAARSGAPTQISLSAKENLVALACQKPKDFGIPLSHWNREMLAKVAISEGIVEKISGGYVSKILKKSGHSSS